MAAVIGVVTLIIGATSVFGELQHALDVIWSSTAKPDSGWWGMVRRRLLSFGMVLGVGFLLLVSLIASAVLAAFGGWLQIAWPGPASRTTTYGLYVDGKLITSNVQPYTVGTVWDY